ncbi:hypothetical protein JYU21_01540 [Alkaliphilus sp. AH-315-G20]|nr:hypothetical protein [bacterium AH-315-L21]MBN4062852.1 hypothetical protein [Alkaliphilus sp. AH-315-G20]
MLNYENKTKQILTQILRDMDDFAEMKNINYPAIYLLGGSACILAGYFDRATTDFDLLDMEYKAEMGRLFRLLDNFDMLDIYLTTIALDFKKRAVKLEEYKNIYVLAREDIITAKLARFCEKDIEDIALLLEKTDVKKLVRLIDTVCCRKDLSERVLNAFKDNVEKFKVMFNV